MVGKLVTRGLGRSGTVAAVQCFHGRAADRDHRRAPGPRAGAGRV